MYKNVIKSRTIVTFSVKMKRKIYLKNLETKTAFIAIYTRNNKPVQFPQTQSTTTTPHFTFPPCKFASELMGVACLRIARLARSLRLTHRLSHARACVALEKGETRSRGCGRRSLGESPRAARNSPSTRARACID